MKRRWNFLLYLGFLLTLVAFLSYFLFFYRFPVTRDIPWVNWLLFGVALVFLGMGLIRAYRQAAIYRGKISGPILAALSLAIVGMFSYIVFFHTKELPASKQAPQVGQKAPDFTLPDPNGKQVALSSLLAKSAPAPATGHADQWVLLIFYRGYW
ncbi:MAG TPA: hypothetical protein VG051_03260 [Candidatus Acidoferrum sp.]|jgi:hypothetical protein|nr:hypothetical protein [Candidatus Acidoferrum sp.]